MIYMDNFSLDNRVKTSRRPIKNSSVLNQWLLDKKIVKNKAQANLLLFGIIFLSLLLIIILNWPASVVEDIDPKYYQDIILDE